MTPKVSVRPIPLQHKLELLVIHFFWREIRDVTCNLPIDPTSYALLQKAQPTSAAVERSFFMLSKLLRKDRNFDVKKVKKYMMLYYNKKSWQFYCVAFVKNIIDRLLMYSTVAITTHFLYYTLIDTGTHNGSLS